MIHRPSKTLRVGDCCADIQDAVGLIAEYTRGLTAEDFVADTIDAHKTRDSVVKNMVDIGEAANNIMQLAPVHAWQMNCRPTAEEEHDWTEH